MHDTMSNIEKFNIAMPSKEDRRLLMQKNKFNEENMRNFSPKNSNKVHYFLINIYYELKQGRCIQYLHL